MAKQKYAPNVLENIRWFIKHRHDFSFSGSSNFLLKRVHIYKRNKSDGILHFANTMSEASFKNAFGSWDKRYSEGEKIEWFLELEAEDCVQYDPEGVSAIDAFIGVDSYGVVKPTRHPRLLFTLLNTKASLNLFIKMYAEDRAKGILPKVLFQSEIVEPFEFLPWMVEAVENQKGQYYDI